MTYEDAFALILREGYPGADEDNAPYSVSDPLYIVARMGDDPGAERMQNLLAALRIVFDGLEDAGEMDRRLAYALWILGESVPMNLRSADGNEQGKFRDELQEELEDLYAAVESIFSNDWNEVREA